MTRDIRTMDGHAEVTGRTEMRLSQPRQSLDGGVRIAGGPLGLDGVMDGPGENQSQMDLEESRSTISTLPPSYYLSRP